MSLHPPAPRLDRSAARRVVHARWDIQGSTLCGYSFDARMPTTTNAADVVCPDCLRLLAAGLSALSGGAR